MQSNPQAIALNEQIGASHPAILKTLSARGKGIFFPKEGIIAQTAAAKGKEINATIGSALDATGGPLHLPSLASLSMLSPQEIFSYAPPFGRPLLRELWSKKIREANPALAGAPMSQPVVTSALTHGLSMCGYLFLDQDDEVILPDQYWGNYRLTFCNSYGAKLRTFNTFVDNHFDVEAMKQAIEQSPCDKKIVLLNFPNNPTGYTPSDEVALEIARTLTELAEAGHSLVVLCDDAYFGLVYETGIFTESLFALLANASTNLLAVKIDGPTKEDYVWGFRVGFVTFAIKDGTAPLYDAFEQKIAGAIRGNISNASNQAQAMLERLYNASTYAAEKQSAYDLMKSRYDTVKKVLENNPHYESRFVALPYNSGYFMCVQLLAADANAVRLLLLDKYNTGVIALGPLIRIAFSATPTEKIATLFENLYQAIGEVAD